MLVLSRKSGECVRIGSSIEVKVLEITGGRVKLGFSAPLGVAIQRNELRREYPRPLASWGRSSVVGEKLPLPLGEGRGEGGLLLSCRVPSP